MNQNVFAVLCSWDIPLDIVPGIGHVEELSFLGWQNCDVQGAGVRMLVFREAASFNKDVYNY